MYKLKWSCKYTVYPFLLWMLSACSQQHAGLMKALRTLDTDLLSTGYYVIIPNQGCEGCISTAEDFVKRHYTSSPQVKYIFTRTQSLKLLQIKLGREILRSSRVLVDSANIIRYPDRSKDIYPMIVTVKGGRITDIAYQRPEEDGLEVVLRKE